MNYLMLKDKLKGEYAKVFDKVQLYVEVRNMNGTIVEDMMMNLLDMLLTAQDEEKPADKIIGNDIEKFCQSYFEEYNIQTRIKNQIPQRVYFFMKCVFILEILELLFCISEENFNLLKATTDISGFMAGLLGGVLILAICNVFVKPFIFRWEKMSAMTFDIITIIASIAMILVCCGLIGDREVNIPMLPVILVSGIYIVLYVIVRAVLRYKDHGSIWKEEKIFQGSWFRGIRESVEMELPAEFVKKYDRINKRRMRWGKEEMTPDEFTEKLRKENKNDEKYSMVFVIVLSAVIVGMVIHSAVTESVFDAAILFIILCVLEAPIYYLFFSGMKTRRRVLEKCEEKGVNIIDYANGEQK